MAVIFIVSLLPPSFLPGRLTGPRGARSDGLRRLLGFFLLAVAALLAFGHGILLGSRLDAAGHYPLGSRPELFREHVGVFGRLVEDGAGERAERHQPRVLDARPCDRRGDELLARARSAQCVVDLGVVMITRVPATV
jgi:hypothetical protein